MEDDVLIGMDESDFPRVAILAEQDGSTDKGTAGSFNRPETRKAVIPSANGHTNGRALVGTRSKTPRTRFLELEKRGKKTFRFLTD